MTAFLLIWYSLGWAAIAGTCVIARHSRMTLENWIIGFIFGPLFIGGVLTDIIELHRNPRYWVQLRQVWREEKPWGARKIISEYGKLL